MFAYGKRIANTIFTTKVLFTVPSVRFRPGLKDAGFRFGGIKSQLHLWDTCKSYSASYL